MNIETNADRSWGRKKGNGFILLGESFETMNNAIAQFVKCYPL